MDEIHGLGFYEPLGIRILAVEQYSTNREKENLIVKTVTQFVFLAVIENIIKLSSTICDLHYTLGILGFTNPGKKLIK